MPFRRPRLESFFHWSSFAFQAPVISSLTGGADGSLERHRWLRYTPTTRSTPDLRRPESNGYNGFYELRGSSCYLEASYFSVRFALSLVDGGNPESGTILLHYDANSNLSTKVSPRTE